MTTKDHSDAHLICDKCGKTFGSGNHFPFWAGSKVGADRQYRSNNFTQGHTTLFIDKYSSIIQMNLDLCSDCVSKMKKRYFYRNLVPIVLFPYVAIMALMILIYNGNKQLLQMSNKFISATPEQIVQQNRNIIVMGITLTVVILTILIFMYSGWMKSDVFKNRFFFQFINTFNSLGPTNVFNFVYCELRPLALSKAFRARYSTIWTDPQYREQKRVTDMYLK